MTYCPAVATAVLPLDGRARRTARSRAAIEGALFELIGEGRLQPTAQEVAVRAGVAPRSVFRHFSDTERLFASIDARLRREAAVLVERARPSGTLPERLRAMVRLRATVFERIAPYKRSADLQRWRSPFIQRQQRALARQLRAGLRRWLPELAAAPPDVREALELVTSFEAWERLRAEQGLGRTRAAAVMTTTAAAILGPPAASSARRRRKERP
jgi:TetR/AcrR family transcriptional regulator, regulator of autoinduction and epiphytic fitness